MFLMRNALVPLRERALLTVKEELRIERILTYGEDKTPHPVGIYGAFAR